MKHKKIYKKQSKTRKGKTHKKIYKKIKANKPMTGKFFFTPVVTTKSIAKKLKYFFNNNLSATPTKPTCLLAVK